MKMKRDLAKVYCSKCGKCMTSKNGTSFIGISIQVSISDEERTKNPELAKLAQKQLGKYKMGTVHQFCYECWLDSLYGVK